MRQSYNRKSCTVVVFVILSADAPASMAATLDVTIPVTATFMCFTWPLQRYNHDCSMSMENYSSSSTPRSFREVRDFKAQAHMHHTRTSEIHHKLAEVVQWCLLAEHHLNGGNVINRKINNDNTIETYALSEKSFAKSVVFEVNYKRDHVRTKSMKTMTAVVSWCLPRQGLTGGIINFKLNHDIVP